MRRREFLAFVGIAAIASARPVRGQQADHVRRIGVLFGVSGGDAQQSIEAFETALREHGLQNHVNVQLMYRFGTSTADLAAANAKEIVALKPDLILVSTSPGVAAILRETRSIPTVFTNVADPVGSGFVSSFSRLGGNITGFANFEPSMSGKWLEILKDLAPSVRRVMILFNPETAPNAAYFPSLKVAAPSLSIELFPTPAHDPAEIEAAVSSFAKEANGGVIPFPDITMYTHRKILIGLTAKYQLPAVYGYRMFVSDGGLVSYGLNGIEPLRRAADYVDRILKGANPSDLPVQGPVKFELGVNLKTAKALGLTIPLSLLAQADEVIE